MNRWIIASAATLAAATLMACAPAPAVQAQNAPFARGAAEKDPAAEKLEAAAAKLEAQSKKAPKDSKLKEKAAEAYFKAGHAFEYSKVLAPRAKYRNALRLYRKSLAFNPKHAKAAAEKKQIEDIYKQMGMPIPK